MNDLQEIAVLRHSFHRIPEIAGAEFETSALIREMLEGIPGLKVFPPFLKTDVVAELKGEAGPGPVIALRADIDGLPLEEKTGCPFPSEHPGMAHACGHDVHITCLIGAAKELSARRKEFCGTIRFIWQPGEENRSMGRELVAAGALGDPLPKYCAALHVEPGKPAGMISSRIGAMMSASNHFKVTVKGRGGHGSLPSAARSPLVAAAAMVTELQMVIGNRIDPRRSGVLSICHFESGTIDNIIPETAFFAGTLRSLDNETAVILETTLHEVCEAMAKVYQVECDVHSNQSYLATVTSAEPFELLKRSVEKQGMSFMTEKESNMASEDFSFMLAKVPGVFFRLGIGEDQPTLHNPALFPPDSVLEYGVRAMTGFALEALKK